MPQPPRRPILAALALMGGLSLLGGLFFPWIIRVDYLPHAGCPDGPRCPPPGLDTRSYWSVFVHADALREPSGWVSALWPTLVIAVTLLQGIIAARAWQGRHSRELLRAGLIVTLLMCCLYVLTAWVQYCLFFCSPSIPPPGVFHAAPGLFGGAGIRYLAPGFWLLLAGFLLSLSSNVALLMGPWRDGRAG